MGWSSGWNTREELVASCTRAEPRTYWPARDGCPGHWHTREILAKACVGNHLWHVAHVTAEYAESPDGPVTGRRETTLIVLDLLKKDGGDWGHKGMSEAEGPYYYTCPLKFLAMAPEASAEWRAKVREYHALRSAKLAVGDVVVLLDSCKPNRLTVTRVKPLAGRDEATGGVYNVPRKWLKAVEKAGVAATV